MFIKKSEICNFAIGEGISSILENLKHGMKILLTWFRINSLQTNPGKFQFMILGKKNWNSVNLIINSTEIEESEKAVLLESQLSVSMLLTYIVQQIINCMHYEE